MQKLIRRRLLEVAPVHPLLSLHTFPFGDRAVVEELLPEKVPPPIRHCLSRTSGVRLRLFARPLPSAHLQEETGMIIVSWCSERRETSLPHECPVFVQRKHVRGVPGRNRRA